MKINHLARWGQVGLLVLLGAGAGFAQESGGSLAGRWDAVVTANGVEVPFQFELAGEGPAIKGSFFNGPLRITSTAGNVENGVLVLNFDQYATKLRASVTTGQLAGEYQRTRGPYPFRASRASSSIKKGVVQEPSIDGTWIVAARSSKGEGAVRAEEGMPFANPGEKRRQIADPQVAGRIREEDAVSVRQAGRCQQPRDIPGVAAEHWSEHPTLRGKASEHRFRRRHRVVTEPRRVRHDEEALCGGVAGRPRCRRGRLATTEGQECETARGEPAQSKVHYNPPT